MRLRFGFTWLLSGSALYAACQLGLVGVLTRLGGAEQVGQYALGMAVSAPVMMFTDFQLRALIAADLRGRFTFAEYLAFRMIALTGALAVVILLAAFTQNTPEAGLVMVAVGAAQGIDLLSDTYYGVMQRRERLDRVSRSLLVKGPLGLAAFALAMYLWRDVLMAVLALIAARLTVFLLWDSRTPVDRLPAPRRPRLPALLRLAAPLGAVAMLSSFNANVPRYFLESHDGKAALGLYAPIASLLSAGSLIMSAQGQTFFVPVAQAHASGDRKRYQRFVAQALVVGGGLGLGALMVALGFGRELLSLLFGGVYGSKRPVLVILTCVGALSFMISGLGYIMTASGVLRPQVWLMVASIVTVVAASAILVPRYGGEGAAFASAVGAAVQLAGMLWFVWRATPVQNDDPSPSPARDLEGVA